MNAQKFTPSDLNEGFVVAIQINAKPGQEDRLANSLEALVEPTTVDYSLQTTIDRSRC